MSVVPTDAQPCNEKLLSDLLNENTSDISPQSRNEAFLLGLINKVVPDIIPVSRVECYLKALCEKNAGTDAVINEDGHLIITLSTGKQIDAGYAVGPSGADGKDGSDGQPGADGIGIKSVVQTTTSTEDGGTNVITVTKTDGSTSTIEVRNGSKGSTGAAGTDGKDGTNGKDGVNGTDGYTPQRGVDYWTAEDQQAIVDAVLAALPSGDEVSY